MHARSLAAIATLSVALSAVAPALAKPDQTVTVPKGNGGAEVSIPAHAVKIADDVYSLGYAEVDGKKVEGIMVVHRSNAKPGGPATGGSTCYSYLAADAKWKSQEPWVVNAANNFGLTSAFLLSTVDAAIAEWETAAGAQILGAGSLTTAALSADQTAPDGSNEIYFGAIAEPGVIAVTTTWGTFGGPAKNRQIVEMDQVYDQVDFTWSNTGLASAMDFENIAQHELGHGLGMGHAPTSTACAAEAMYPYASNGETLKRTLGPGDIAGIDNLY